MSEPRILVVGSANMDLVVEAERVPLPGETLLGGRFHQVRGGKGANQAVAAARLGAVTWLLGRVGADAFGANLLAGLTENCVHTEFVQYDPDAPSGVAVILVQANGENSIVVAPGANGRCSVADLDAIGDWSALDALLVQLEVPLPVVEGALRRAQQAGIIAVLDAGPPRGLPTELLVLPTVVSPNQSEARAILGLPPAAELSPEEAARGLLRLGARAVALKLGPEGSLVATPDGMERVPAFAVTPVDTTGAGDAFTAALGVALARGASLPEAAHIANAAGALATTVVGAQPSMPTREAVEGLLSAPDSLASPRE